MRNITKLGHEWAKQVIYFHGFNIHYAVVRKAISSYYSENTTEAVCYMIKIW